MLYYLSTKEQVKQNEAFENYLKSLEKGVRDYLFAALPPELATDDKADYRLRNLETAIVTDIMKGQKPIHDPILLCGMNENGIRWNRLFAVPHGKEIVIVDDDGDTYTFDEFDELAGETCELTQKDEKLLETIRASQDEPESDKWRMCIPESL